ncbi:MAG: S41 family peptidase [Anaerolineae bacterium]
MPDPTNTRLKYGLACCLIVALAACLLTYLCAVGVLAWQSTTQPAPPPTYPPPPTLFPALTPTPDDETTARHLRIFTELWEIVRDDYLYPDYNGADWESIGQEYRARVEAGLGDEDFWIAMDEMLLELDDEHSIFLSPAAAQEEDRELAGELEYVGIGVYTTVPWEIEKEYAVVLLVLPDSPAERAGLRPHDHILTVDGHPACCDPFGYDYLDRLTGSEGSEVELQVRTPGQPSRTVTMTRTLIQGSLPVEARLLEGNVGYILIPTFWDETVVERVRQALEELTAKGELAGLIIDNRVNPGGSDIVLKELLAFFTDGEVGRFVGSWGEEPVRVNGIDVGGSQHVRLAILVGRETASFAEVFSGVLQEAGRAGVVGRTTSGNVETTWSYDFEDGARAWIALETFRPPSGTDWEETGIIPDVEIPLDWDEFTAEDDPQLEAALDLLRQ